MGPGLGQRGKDQDWGQGLPDTLVYCLAESPDGATVMCGTQNSVYRRDAADPLWMDAAGNRVKCTYWACNRCKVNLCDACFDAFDHDRACIPPQSVSVGGSSCD